MGLQYKGDPWQAEVLHIEVQARGHTVCKEVRTDQAHWDGEKQGKYAEQKYFLKIQ